MFDRYLRRLKDRWLAPLAGALGPHVPPDLVTVLALLVGLGSAYNAYAGGMRLALALWLVNRALDGLDGTLARLHQRESAFGAYLDIVLDFVVYAAIPAALVVRDPTPAIARAGIALLAAFYVNAASWMYLSAILEQRREGAAITGEDTKVTMPAGLIGGTETIAFYSAFFVWPPYQPALFYAMAILLTVTIGVRVAWARRHLR
jgi:phosphatidylglycerophosphate synthase